MCILIEAFAWIGDIVIGARSNIWRELDPINCELDGLGFIGGIKEPSPTFDDGLEYRTSTSLLALAQSRMTTTELA